MRLTGTFYIDPGDPRTDALNDSQLQTLAAKHEVGSHTWSHINLARCDATTIRKELIMSKEYLESITKRSVFGLAYPYGQHLPSVQRLAQECGYLFARTILEGRVDFPPSNPYSWGITVCPLPVTLRPMKKLLSRRELRIRKLPRLDYLGYLIGRGQIYAKNLAVDWPSLAVKLFDRARLAGGVWHLFGHAHEVLHSGLENDFRRLCQHVSLRKDIWYATNGMLFLNEAIKNSVRIVEDHGDARSIFRICVKSLLATAVMDTPVTFRLVVPSCARSSVRVMTTNSGKFETRRFAGHVTIDIFDKEAQIEVTRD